MSMGEMTMPGGWTMSMIWMRMPGQTWPGAAASFVGMWTVMMAAMMLPSLVPTLRRCRCRQAAIVSAGYFLVWSTVGLAVFLLGTALAAIEMRAPALARAVPAVAAVVVVCAGALQFTPWKARHLACCRKAPGPDAWRDGLRLGLHCSCACAGLTAILLVAGVMDVYAMTGVTAAITAERVAADGQRVARAIGVVAFAAGLLLAVRGLR